MSHTIPRIFFPRIAHWPTLVLIAILALYGTASAQTPQIEELVSAVVRVKAFINPDGRTVQTLGREREGSGVVIDDAGLIVTIGYLMVEAHATEIVTNAGRTVAADVVGYDPDTGFGLLRTTEPLKIRPMPLGTSADVKVKDPVLIASAGGPQSVAPAFVVEKREFVGYWEYLLDEAIFTTPPHPAWSGAALINRDGKLVGIGSLIVPDTSGKGDKTPGNMFVPIDLLPPILADLIADGRPAGLARPWLGITTSEMFGGLIVSQVTAGGPAERAGLARGDVIVGVGGETLKSQSDFYRKIWALGAAGTTVPLDVLKDRAKRRVEVTSMSRMDHLRLKSTF